MKRLKLAIFLLSVAMVGLVSCSSNNSNKKSNNPTKPNEPEVVDPVDHNPRVTFTISGYSITNIKVESSKDTIDLVIPDEIDGTAITQVSWRSFSDSSLRGKTIDKLVIGKNMRDVCFYGTEGKINDVEVSSENEIYMKSGKFLLSKDSKTFFWSPAFEISELPSTIENIEGYSFINYSGSSLTLPSQIKRLENNAIPQEFATVNLNNGLEYIGFSALNVNTIIVPASVTSLEYSSFGNRLNSVFVDSGNTTYDSRNNCCMVVEKATNKVIITSKTYSFPSTVTAIATSAFGYTYNYTNITIPDTVTRLDLGAFRYCYNLEYLTLPSNVEIYSNSSKSNNLSYIVQGCYKLKSFNCPNTITKLDKSSLSGLNNLEELYIPKLTTIEDDCFANTPKLSKLYVNMTQSEWEALNYVDTSNRLANVEIIFNATQLA